MNILDDGKLIPIEIEESLENISDNTLFINSLKPKAKIGSKKSYTIKISNEAMGLPSLAFGALSYAAKKKAAKLAAKAITKKLGTKFMPGLNLFSFILSSAA